MSLIKSYLHANMNRSKLQQQLIDKMIEGMDFKTMWSVLYDYMDESYDKYSDEELKTEVEEYYPELLEETDISELEATANNYTTGK